MCDPKLLQRVERLRAKVNLRGTLVFEFSPRFFLFFFGVCMCFVYRTHSVFCNECLLIGLFAENGSRGYKERRTTRKKMFVMRMLA